MGALPPQVRWKPQQLGDAIAARLSLVTSGTFALFAAGSTEPSSNVGPWLKDSNTWYVWSNSLGQYVPQTLAPESLGYTIGANPPDPNSFAVWIETNLAGSPLAVKIYYSGAWVDVYAAKLASYQTIAAFNAAIANYSTTAAMNAAIAAAVAAIPAATKYPARATLSGTQSVAVSGAYIKLLFDSEVFDPNTVYNPTLSRYVAPVAGYYRVSSELQVDNNTGTAAAMEIILSIYLNGITDFFSSGCSVASPPGSRWYPITVGTIQLAAGDYIEMWLKANDGVLTGLVNVGVQSSFCIELIQPV